MTKLDVGDRFTHSDGKQYEIVGHYAMSYKTQRISPVSDKPWGQVFSMIPPDGSANEGAPVVSINLRFRVIDQEAFNKALVDLEETLWVDGATEGTLEEKVITLVTHLDVLAVYHARQEMPLGWLAVGLERIQ